MNYEFVSANRMGLIYEHLTRLFGERLGRPVAKAIPATVGDAVRALVLLTGWLTAAGLVLTGLVWLVSGAIAWSMLPLALGLALAYVLASIGRRAQR